MASAKQIAWRKKFARMSKAGKFRKKASIKRTVDYSTKPISIKSEIKYGKFKKGGGVKNPSKTALAKERKKKKRKLSYQEERLNQLMFSRGKSKR